MSLEERLVVEKRLRTIEEHLRICDQCHMVGQHKVDCSKQDMRECWGDVPEQTPQDESIDLLHEVEQLEADLDNTVKELSDMRFSRDLQKSNFMVSLKGQKELQDKLDKSESYNKDLLSQREYWKEKLTESEKLQEETQDKLTKTISLIYGEKL